MVSETLEQGRRERLKRRRPPPRVSQGGGFELVGELWGGGKGAPPPPPGATFEFASVSVWAAFSTLGRTLNFVFRLISVAPVG